MIVYIDTEFTDLSDAFGPIKLISAAFVPEDGKELYFELTDSYGENDCSDFVAEHVLPHLDNKKYGMTSKEAAAKLWEFILSFGEPVILGSDAPDYDFNVLAAFMREQCYSEFKAQVLDLRNYQINMLYEHYFDYQPLAIRHHALWDARALASTAKGSVND